MMKSPMERKFRKLEAHHKKLYHYSIIIKDLLQQQKKLNKQIDINERLRTVNRLQAESIMHLKQMNHIWKKRLGAVLDTLPCSKKIKRHE